MALLIVTYFVFMINEMCNVGRKITSERSYDIGQTINEIALLQMKSPMQYKYFSRHTEFESHET